jgi:hypothetical protein
MEHSHFHEIELLRVVVKNEFNSAGANVVDSLRGGDCLGSKIRTQICGETWGGRLEQGIDDNGQFANETTRLLDDLLVPPLDRTIPFPKTYDTA